MDAWAAVPIVSSRGNVAGVFAVPPVADELTGSQVTNVLSVYPLGAANRCSVKIVSVEVPREDWKNVQ